MKRSRPRRMTQVLLYSLFYTEMLVLLNLCLKSLKEVIEFKDLDVEVFQVFREIGNTIALIGLFDKALVHMSISFLEMIDV